MKKTHFRPSYRRHRRQFFWQILAPLLGVGLLLGVIGALALAGSMDQASLWADTALIGLLLPLLPLFLIPLGVTVAAVVGMASLLQAAPSWFAQAQRWMNWQAAQARRWSNKLAAPFIRLGGWQAAVGRILRRKRPGKAHD